MAVKPVTQIVLRNDTPIGRTVWLIERRTRAIEEFRQFLEGACPEKWKGVERQTIEQALAHEIVLLEDLLSQDYYETTIKPELDKIRAKYLCKEEQK